MGNVAMVCGGRPGGSTEPVEPRSPVTVLQSNGNVLSLYSSRIRVVDLILDYPNHFVCHSSSLVLLHHSKILPLHTLLVPGEVYFLLPMPSNRPHQHHQDNESDTSSLLHIEPPRRATTGSSTKFVISTEQFSRIMAGSIVKDGKGGSSSSSSSGKRNRHHGRSGSSKTTTTAKGMSSSSSSSGGGGNSITAPIAAPWRPALSSIEEVAAN